MNYLYAIIEEQVLCVKDENFVITKIICGNVRSARSFERNLRSLTIIKVSRLSIYFFVMMMITRNLYCFGSHIICAGQKSK